MPGTFKVTLTTVERQAEAFAALLTETLDPPPAVSVSEAGTERLLEAYFVERPDLDLLGALLAATGEAPDAETSAPAAPAALQLHAIAEENWVALVQRGLHPVRAGRFLIHGSHDRGAGAGRRYAIEIEAGRAFGTAHHGTTRGCLMAIDSLAKRRDWRRVLDVGTGSGVLAIAAAKASRARVLASDIDPVAVAVARENIALSGVSGAIRAVTAAGVGDSTIRALAPYDLILANILAGPLIKLAPRLSRLAAPGGHVVLSGLLDAQAREVGATYRRLGLVLERRISLEGWSTLMFRAGAVMPGQRLA
jgi:ribosomal protein L11 methyltransferase